MSRARQRGRHRSGVRRSAAPTTATWGVWCAALVATLLATGGLVGAGLFLRSGSEDLVRISVPRPPVAQPVRATIGATITMEPRVPDSGTGECTTARTDGISSGSGLHALRYSVEVEGSLDVAPVELADVVEETLADSRGWVGLAEHEFQRVEQGQEVRVLLATPNTVDVLCAPLQTDGEVSCRNRDRVVINAKRWFFGADPFNKPLRLYRRSVINHEVGHALGYGHQACPEPGAVAPVMLQQTLGLDGCEANPWPVAGPPPGV